MSGSDIKTAMLAVAAEIGSALLRKRRFHLWQMKLKRCQCRHVSHNGWTVKLFSLQHFGRPFVKRFALCYQTVVCLSVTLVHCGQTVGWIKMKLGTQVGLSPGHIVLHGDPAPPPQRGTVPQFSAHFCCGQMAAWIKMPLDTEVGLGPGE